MTYGIEDVGMLSDSSSELDSLAGVPEMWRESLLSKVSMFMSGLRT